MPVFVKHRSLIFLSAVSERLTSSRYLGIPPVTERSRSFSFAEIDFLRKKRLHSGIDNSRSGSSSEIRPTKSLPLSILSLIQVETLPHRTSIIPVLFLNSVSHATFRT